MQQQGTQQWGTQRTGRPTKFSARLSETLIGLLAMGCTIEDACSQVGITRTTFYNWLQRSEELQSIDPSERIATTPEDLAFLGFFDAVTRAQGTARIVAVGAIRSAIVPQPQVSETVETFTETRLRANAEGEEVPYLYERTLTRRTVTELAPDWRAAVEYLKRRDPGNWAPPTQIEINWRDKAVADIRAGLVTFEALAKAFNDESLAAELFRTAGVPASTGTGET